MLNPVGSTGSYGTLGTSGTVSSFIKKDETKLNGFQSALSSAVTTKDDEKLMNAARDFESYFLQTMYKEMRNTVKSGGVIPMGSAENAFQSMLDEENSKNAAKGEGMGLAKMIYRQMKQTSNAVSADTIPDSLVTKAAELPKNSQNVANTANIANSMGANAANVSANSPANNATTANPSNETNSSENTNAPLL